MIRILVLLAALAVAACARQDVAEAPLKDLGEFRLGHNVVVAPKMQKVPVSREATEEEWISSLTNAFAERMGRYEGSQLYHLGVSVEGYALAPPGLPLVAAPKSALVILVTVWDDAAATKLNEEPEQLVIFEDFGEGAIVGSGMVNTREEQLQNLSVNAAARLERFLAEMHEEKGWFALREAPAEEVAELPAAAPEEG
jgi:hypothetical protein